MVNEKSFLDEVLYELKHLKSLVFLVEKRGRHLNEVSDLRKRIYNYINSIPSDENVESVSEIRWLISYLSNF